MDPKGDDSYYNFDTTSIIGNYRGTNLAYDMLCAPISQDNYGKEGYRLSGNRLFNIKFTTNIEKFPVCQQCAQDKALQNKIEEERD